jgi:3-oxoacyl-[acyl-carrier-protein] synthase I
MKKVYITSYSCISSLGTGLKESLESLSNETQLIHRPAKDDNLFLPYFSLKNSINTDKNKIICSSLALDLLSIIEKDFIDLKPGIPLFLATSTGGIKETENVYNDIVNKKIQYPLFERHFFNKIFDDINEKYPDKIIRAGTFSTACSSSGISLFQACNYIKNGIIDRALVIGVDALSLTTLVGFHSLKLVSETNTKPLTKERDWLSLGEGGGILLLESEPRNTPVAEILGCHTNSDGYHISSPDPEGTEQKECIKAAIKNSGITLDDIDYINAHGTGTIMNDEVELKVIQSMFAKSIPVSSLKAFIGHTLGASAVIEIALCLGMLKKGFIYQVKGLGTPMDEKFIPSSTVKKNVEIFLKNSFGFGGSNASIVIKNL